MGENQYFQSFTPPASTTTLYAPPLIYNPYIHGTTSNILPLLVHTDFQLMSPMDMLSNYQLAPLSGELTGGGLARPDLKCYPCFGQLYVPYSAYTLSDVISYTKNQEQNIDIGKLKQSIENSIKYGNRSLFFYLNYLLIDVARYRMLGGNLSEIEGIQQLPERIQVSVSVLYFYLLMRKHTVVDETQFSKATTTISWICYQRPETVSEEAIIDLLLSTHINLEDAYEKYSKEKWQAILDSMPLFIDKLSNVFQATEAPFQPPDDGTYDDAWMDTVLNNSYNRLQNSFYSHSKKLLGAEYSQALIDNILNYIKTISNHVETLDKILKQPDSYYQQLLSELSTQPSFPIILVYELADDVSVYGHSKAEFRVNHSLKLGEDIKTVATTPDHQVELQQFFSNYHIQVNVITIEELKQKEQALLSRFETSASVIKSPVSNIPSLRGRKQSREQCSEPWIASQARKDEIGELMTETETSPPIKIGALEQAQGMTFFQVASANDSVLRKFEIS